MEWFGGSAEASRFEMYSVSHLVLLGFFLLSIVGLFLGRKKINGDNWRRAEIGAAFFLILFEMTYHLWMIDTGLWKVGRSLPLELCNIGLILTIILLLTGKKAAYELLFFIGLLGATQAIMSPALTFDFPHFRFFHFFITHMVLVWVALYFTWVKGYSPTFRSVIKLVIFLNLLLPIILLVNSRADGNYWFLRHKPEGPSLYDLLGPYPWYIFSLEALLVVLSLGAWLIFRKWKKSGKENSYDHYEA